MLIGAGLGGTEAEDGEEEYHQLPPHEAVSEDQGTDQAGQVKREDKRAPRGNTFTLCMYGDDLSQWLGELRGRWLLSMYRKGVARRCLDCAFEGAKGNKCAILAGACSHESLYRGKL